MSRIGDLDTTCVYDICKDCDNCGECDDDNTTYCCMDSMKECDGCWNC